MVVLSCVGTPAAAAAAAAAAGGGGGVVVVVVAVVGAVAWLLDVGGIVAVRVVAYGELLWQLQWLHAVPVPLSCTLAFAGGSLLGTLRKTKMMWDVQRIHGSSGKNAGIIKALVTVCYSVWFLTYCYIMYPSSFLGKMVLILVFLLTA